MYRISSLTETIHRLQSEIATSRTTEKLLEEALLQVQEVQEVKVGDADIGKKEKCHCQHHCSLFIIIDNVKFL